MNKFLILFLTAIILIPAIAAGQSADDAIQPWSKNQWYWQYKGEPVMLLGASSDDNLFQWPAKKLIPHLDSMKMVGANYVRCTMSDRVFRGFELYPYQKISAKKFDLNKWNKEYWERFQRFLKETAKRGIIIQIEVWDRFDYSRENWPPHPYNPVNNINYTMQESGLDTVYPNHPGANDQPFFFTTPKQNTNEVVLKFQKKFVGKLLSYSLDYDNVLYCMDNETSGEEAWGAFWAEFIRGKATEENKKVYLTEMWDDWDLKSEEHKQTFDHPERYDFCDVSQNNHQRDQAHWDNFQWVRNYISSQPRPINKVKTYGADGGNHGTTNNAIDSWWRHILGGVASARFHRPPSGLGLSDLTMASVKAAREIESIVKFWNLNPDNDLLSEREENEAYLATEPGENYVIFFPDEGEVGLNLKDFPSSFTLKWMNVRDGEWHSSKNVEGGKMLNLAAPGKNEWVAVITKQVN